MVPCDDERILGRGNLLRMWLEVLLPKKLRAISELSVALAPILMLAACDRPGPTTDINPAPPPGAQESAAALVEPHRYLRLSDLAGAIRKAGRPCEVVRSYKQIERNDKGNAIYRVDCLEYSYRLAINNGQSRIERLTANVVSE